MGQAEFMFGPVGLSREEEIVLDLIKAHPGREQAISLPALALRTGIDERRVQSIVRELIITHGARIDSTSGSPPGYFWISTQEEVERAYDRLLKRGRKIILRASRLRGMSLDDVLGQIRLEFDGEETGGR